MPGPQTSLRIPPDVLARIDKHASERKMNRTAYIVAAALGELDKPPERPADVADTLSVLELRLNGLSVTVDTLVDAHNHRGDMERELAQRLERLETRLDALLPPDVDRETVQAINAQLVQAMDALSGNADALTAAGVDPELAPHDPELTQRLDRLERATKRHGIT